VICFDAIRWESAGPFMRCATTKSLNAGGLATLRGGGVEEQVVEGQPVAADVRYVGLANQRRGGADSFTKILFQYAARHAPLTIETIVAVLRASPPAPPAVSSA
jgi:hypothetical protein